MYHSFHKNISQHCYKNDNKMFLKQQISMISVESCDTEDWSNDAENSALHQRDKLHFKNIQIESSHFK